MWHAIKLEFFFSSLGHDRLQCACVLVSTAGGISVFRVLSAGLLGGDHAFAASGHA